MKALDYDEKNAYRYKVLCDGVVVEKGWAYDINRREVAIHSRMHGRGRVQVKRVGGRVSIKRAEEWIGRKL